MEKSRRRKILLLFILNKRSPFFTLPFNFSKTFSLFQSQTQQRDLQPKKKMENFPNPSSAMCRQQQIQLRYLHIAKLEVLLYFFLPCSVFLSLPPSGKKICNVWKVEYKSYHIFFNLSRKDLISFMKVLAFFAWLILTPILIQTTTKRIATGNGFISKFRRALHVGVEALTRTTRT